MNCPMCGKAAKTERGLRKHLTGTRPYGGHEFDEARATAVASAATAVAGRTASGAAVGQAPLPAPPSAIRRPPPVAPPGLGPQYAPDPPFKARMRRHQSWYRAEILGVACGTGPQRSSSTHYGNMLDAAAAGGGANFLTPGIFGVARSRIAEGGGVEPFRCLHNMLSSQPMCFNLFGPLVADHELATRLIAVLLPGEVEEVLDVRVEYAPSPKREFLDDRTAFDALVVYRRPDGETAFLGVETKLTEPFSPLEYVKPGYVALTERDDSIWRREAWPVLRASAANQLWRNQLLVEATRRHPDHPHGRHGRSAIVRHPLDTDCARAVAAYAQTLVDATSTFADWPLDHLVARWRTVVCGAEERAWLRAFERRYLDVDASAGRPATAVPAGCPGEPPVSW